MNRLTAFQNQNYLNLETLRANGEALPTPVWFVQDGDALFVRTIANSGKVKRLRKNPNVRIMPCGRAGEPLGEWINARATEITSEDVYACVKEWLIAKYGEMVLTFEHQAHEKGLRYTIVKINL